ncbi:MAG: hypothetical protein EAZ89_16965 [Bacteroidetes bacterium]|nr:MAG: hypothetical protein EAZ89_16965 [Bacteroidota bacterium]
MSNTRIYALLICLSPLMLAAQIGGRNVYDFLNLPTSAHLAALGGINVSTWDDDLVMATANPALLNPDMSQRAALTFSSYLGGVRYGYAGYARSIKKWGEFHSGIQFLNSGKMQGADEFGNLTGEFSASELAWYLGYSRAWKGFRYGANLKVISSTLAPGYSSWGAAMDLGGAYRSKNELFSAGVTLRNLGAQFSTYVPGAGREPLPFEIVAGVSNKLRYMPMRFSLTLIQLENPILIYRDPNAEPELDLSGNPIEEKNPWADQMFRHAVFSTEFYLGNFLRLRAGYNHLRRQELRAANRGGMTGFSLGAGIRAGRFALDYAFSSYGVQQPLQSHQWSIGLDLEKPAPAAAPAQ